MGFFGKSAEEKQREAAVEAKASRIILTTTDIRVNYEILDIIVSDDMVLESQQDYDNGKMSLKRKAAAIGADAVIGVQCFLAHDITKGNRRWYGTAVKFK